MGERERLSRLSLTLGFHLIRLSLCCLIALPLLFLFICFFLLTGSPWVSLFIRLEYLNRWARPWFCFFSPFQPSIPSTLLFRFFSPFFQKKKISLHHLLPQTHFCICNLPPSQRLLSSHTQVHIKITLSPHSFLSLLHTYYITK